MGRDPPPVLPGRLAAEEAPAEEAAEVWVRWAVLRLALLLMVLSLLLPRRRRPWVLRLWQRVLCVFYGLWRGRLSRRRTMRALRPGRAGRSLGPPGCRKA